MKNSIIQYHPSYTEEQNQIIHNYIEHATSGELVTMIRELQKLYMENIPDTNKKFLAFEQEIRERDILNQKYNTLLNCKNEWRKYITALNNYNDACIIRNAYATFKSNYNGKNIYENFFQQYYDENGMPYCNSDFFRKATISKGRKNYIAKPEPPHIYYSVDEIKTIPLCNDTCLESIGTDNLKYLIKIMLFNIDSPNANDIPISLFFLTRKYANDNHKRKGEIPLFTTTLLTIPSLIENNKRLLTEILALEKESINILTKLKND